MSSKYLRLFLCLCTAVLLARARILRLQCKSYAAYRYVKQDYKLVGAPIVRLRNKPLGDCEVDCVSEPKCKSLNWKGDVCELNSKTISDETDNCTESNNGKSMPGSWANATQCTLKRQDGWIFKSTDYTRLLVGPNCENVNPCRTDELCLDSCEFPGYQCIRCSTVQNLPCPGPCHSGPCNSQNTEQCIDGKNIFTCKCKPGFTGRLCTDKIVYCKPNLCKNGGVCGETVGDYICMCPSVFKGRNCETVKPGACALLCENGGTCEINAAGKSKCKCQTGYEGKTCSTSIG